MYYIYEHSIDNIPFYIGKGTRNLERGYNGYSRAYSKNNRNKKWLEKSKTGYDIKIILESDNLEFILDQENKLWGNCKECVNKQINKKFKDYKLNKINDSTAILYIFNKTYILLKDGSIYNFLGKELKLFDNGKGYKVLTVSKGEKTKKNLYVHRIVAEAFIPNPNNHPNVNHKNTIVQDNNVENLEWCTQLQNIRHSVDLGNYKFIDRRKKVLQFNKKGEFIKEWDMCKLAAIEYNCNEALIQQAAKQSNKCKTAKGFLWIYKEDYENGIKYKFEDYLNMKKLTKEEKNS